MKPPGGVATFSMLLRLSPMLILVTLGCPSSELATGTRVTVLGSETLEEFEGYIPIPPDSVVRLYKAYDRQRFSREYSDDVERTAELLDSLNRSLPPSHWIDTLSIEFSPQQFGTAVRTGKTIYLSSGFYFVYNDFSIIRSILYHEHGHVRYEMLNGETQGEIEQIWQSLRRAALLYVFVDGEYSGNAWFGGHPDESAEELYASAFNLFYNKPDELRSTLRYVPSEYFGIVDSLRSFIRPNGLVLFE
jgi:hypothetical protein